MGSVLAAVFAELVQLQFLLDGLLVAGAVIVHAVALFALQFSKIVL